MEDHAGGENERATSRQARQNLKMAFRISVEFGTVRTGGEANVDVIGEPPFFLICPMTLLAKALPRFVR